MDALAEEERELTDHDVLREILTLALSDSDMTSADVIERVEQLGRPDLIEEARAMQELIEATDDEDEDDEEDEPEEETEDFSA
jgi:hypothetical protein